MPGALKWQSIKPQAVIPKDNRQLKQTLMSQSLSKIYLHCIFSTKYRQHFIKETIRQDLYAYIVGILSHHHSYVEEIGAYSDHIHILCTLPRTITLADLMSKVKASLSKWFKKQGIENFSWQNGYAAFSVSESVVQIIKKYIQNQDKHHKKTTFQDEYREFLKDYSVEYDEKYVWD
jgi:REP element-mobilizing transposase RayT